MVNKFLSRTRKVFDTGTCESCFQVLMLLRIVSVLCEDFSVDIKLLKGLFLVVVVVVAVAVVDSLPYNRQRNDDYGQLRQEN